MELQLLLIVVVAVVLAVTSTAVFWLFSRAVRILNQPMINSMVQRGRMLDPCPHCGTEAAWIFRGKCIHCRERVR